MIDCNYVFTFGKYKTKYLGDILGQDPSYIIWCADNKVLEIPKKLRDKAVDNIYERKQKTKYGTNDMDYDDLNLDATLPHY